MRVLYTVEETPQMAFSGHLGVAPLVAAFAQAIPGFFATGQSASQSVLAFQQAEEEAERKARRTRGMVIGLAVGGTLLLGLGIVVLATKKR